MQIINYFQHLNALAVDPHNHILAEVVNHTKACSQCSLKTFFLINRMQVK